MYRADWRYSSLDFCSLYLSRRLLFRTRRFFYSQTAHEAESASIMWAPSSEKVPSRHVWREQVQISLRECAVSSGPSLSANRIIGYSRMFQWRANARIRLCASVEWYAAHFAQGRRCVFASRGLCNANNKQKTPGYGAPSSAFSNTFKGTKRRLED